MLVIERGKGKIVFILILGVSTKEVKTSYSAAAGTAYVEFDNVWVPIENLLGEENKGFQIIMSNFNHERWFISAFMIARLRHITQLCFDWVNKEN